MRNETESRLITRRNFLILGGLAVVGGITTVDLLNSQNHSVNNAMQNSNQIPTQPPTPELTPNQTPEITPKPTSTPKPTKTTTAEKGKWVKYKGPLVVWHGDLKSQNVYLTQDDGFNPANVEKIAQTAIDNNIRTTICAIGSVIDKSPNLYRDLVKEGFDLENHTYTHSRLDTKTKNQIVKEVLKAKDALDKAAGTDVPQKFLRPPGEFGVTGVKIWQPLLEALQELDYRLLVWDVSSAGTNFGAYSATDKQVRTVEKNVEGNMHNGAIALQHAINVDTKAFPHIVKSTIEKGYKPVTVFEGIK